MRVPLPPQSRLVKKVLPRSLLGRTLLIILIPLAVTIAVALQVFYGSHLDIVSRRFSSAIAGEIAATIELMARHPEDADWALDQAWDKFELVARIRPGVALTPAEIAATDQGVWRLGSPADTDFAQALRQQVGRPFAIDWSGSPQSVRVRVALPDTVRAQASVLEVDVPRKRLNTGTLYLFVAWLAGTAALLFAIAAMFMRIQVRAIRRLARAAEAFGMGRDHGPIRPEGASEVRQAATAFNRMQERLRRFLTQRTEMLAGVSHDLRTPLTRLRLALAMVPPDVAVAADVAGMSSDVDEMDRMIGGYLAFARGEGHEQARDADLAAILRDVGANAARGGHDVRVVVPASLPLLLRPDAVRRAITNLVDNAIRHARKIELGAAGAGGSRTVQVTVDDDGPGIPRDRREGVFRAFESGAHGGTGLGLTIARDIARAHGGDVVLEDSPLGGLRARIVLPI